MPLTSILVTKNVLEGEELMATYGLAPGEMSECRERLSSLLSDKRIHSDDILTVSRLCQLQLEQEKLWQQKLHQIEVNHHNKIEILAHGCDGSPGFGALDRMWEPSPANSQWQQQREQFYHRQIKLLDEVAQHLNKLGRWAATAPYKP